MPAQSTSGIQRLESPDSPVQVADLLAVAAEERKPVRIAGGEGARGLGNPLREVRWTLSTVRLNRMLEYQPTDMTLSVEAGARLADVAATLAEHGQMLPIEATNPEVATIGGLLATALTGPRRYGGGTLRDVLIGISVAYPDRTVGKAGGMVVKNVSGFDMMRLHYGAMGTLGVIVSANFKVLPLPRAEFTAIGRFGDLSSALEAAASLRMSDMRPVALVVRRVDSEWELAARYEGRESGLTAMRARLADGPLGTGEARQGDASRGYWTELIADRAMNVPNEVRLRITSAPVAVVSIAQTLLDAAQSGHTLTRFDVEPGLGMVTLSVEVDAEVESDVVSSLVRRLRADNPRAVVTLLAAPDSAKAGLDVWGAEPETIDIMRALKQEFDPAGILNPGCFVGSI